MGKINYKAIYDKNKKGWYDMTEDPHKYEALLAGHYSEKNHFVYELLQNAEDENATKVVIEYYQDKLVFYHNGDPFDESDVIGVSSMLMGTKDGNDAQTIGRFGMGFKSVFKYTYQPEIYSDNEAFRIESYLLPVEIENGWDYLAEKRKVSCKAGNDTYPFANEKHLTKIIIPFKKYDKKGYLAHVPGDEVYQKLEELSGEILLFLKNIRTLYWVNKSTGQYALISIGKDSIDSNIYNCRFESSQTGGKEEISKYIRFSKTFNHPEMKGAEVSVAFRLNLRGDNINAIANGTDICVYFPTREKRELPFFIHGSFETAVSREKLMTPSDFNDDLFDELGNLIADTLLELAKRELITQAFIRTVILPAFDDEEKNNTIPGFTEKISKVFKEKQIVPLLSGEYAKAKECLIPVPFKIADFDDKEPFCQTLEGKLFVAINNDNQAKFPDYFTWLRDKLGIPVFHLREWVESFDMFEEYYVEPDSDEEGAIWDFYDFLNDNKESILTETSNILRKNNYDLALRDGIRNTWEMLRHKPIILNQDNYLVPTFVDDELQIYLKASSSLKRIATESLVNDHFSRFERLFRNEFHITEFDDLQYVKEKIIFKYTKVEDSMNFESSEDIESEYIYDIQQILSVMKDSNSTKEIQERLSKAYIILVRIEENQDTLIFEKPTKSYLPWTLDGLDTETYFAPVWIQEYGSDEFKERSFGRSIVDYDFYENNQISSADLVKLGVRGTPIMEGPREHLDGGGMNYWRALGNFCPGIDIYALEDNLSYIENFPEEELAQKKSATILPFILKIADKLRGTKRFKKNFPYYEEEAYSSTFFALRRYEWLYDTEMNLRKITEMSRYELNPDIYGEIDAPDEAYRLLEFQEKEQDFIENTIQQVEELDETTQMELLRTLAERFGMELTEAQQKEEDDDWDEEGDFFNPSAQVDDSFPIRPVRNLDYLKKHIFEQFYCADPVKYKSVWHRIRTSRSHAADQEYVRSMYENSGGQTVCQMCQKVSDYVSAVQIANFGIEMPQLNLCLCRECEAKYKDYRNKYKDSLVEALKQAIYELDTVESYEEKELELTEDMSLHFTETHAAELIEIITLLDKYGVPNKESVSEEALPSESDQTFSYIEKEKAIPKDEIARKGSEIVYKQRGTYSEPKTATLDPEKYSLHKAFDGHQPGDIVFWMAKQYEIIEVHN